MLLSVTDPKLKEIPTKCGGLKSWTLSSIDDVKTIMAQRCIQPHLQLVYLLNKKNIPFFLPDGVFLSRMGGFT